MQVVVHRGEEGLAAGSDSSPGSPPALRAAGEVKGSPRFLLGAAARLRGTLGGGLSERPGHGLGPVPFGMVECRSTLRPGGAAALTRGRTLCWGPHGPAMRSCRAEGARPTYLVAGWL
ncbi:hypothetical protein NDU88_002380 [Pleurodeles waltl]|uniref:Uncharacterized protein n=1 Tax=Pleurodeles waltl TaxID=8319 RepID=A0AAV7W357_PLEWA|nr:hypothetical protein NDU88_002380 [Pleurodeles waltl]